MFKNKTSVWVAVIAVVAMMVCCFTGCTSEQKEEKPADTTKTELTKIADHLYEKTYTEDFDWSNTAAPNMAGFSCSAVQNGQYRGRNYDWTYADTDLCIVHTKATKNRPHASVAVSDLSFTLKEDKSIDYAQIPFVATDGINDAGVCVQVNVMPYGENGEFKHTETKEDDLDGKALVRYFLDYSDSVDGALALLKDKDIYTDLEGIEELHWMISGPTSKDDKTLKTVVVEVFPDGLHVTDKFVDDKPIMTNFNISNFDGTKDTVGIGLGYERWQILNENFDQANSVMGTFDLMEKAYFSKMYDLYGDRFWYSEYNGTDISKYYDEKTLRGLIGDEVYDFYMNTYGGVYYTSALWDGEAVIHGDISKTGIIAPVVEKATQSYNEQDMDAGKLWITVHTTVYDLENKTLDIQVRESQDHLHFTIE